MSSQKKNSRQILRPISVKSLKTTSNKKTTEGHTPISTDPRDQKFCKTDFFSNAGSKI
jgi:hypothetical protein